MIQNQKFGGLYHFWKPFDSEFVNEYQKLLKSAEEYFYLIFLVFLIQLKLEEVIFS